MTSHGGRTLVKHFLDESARFLLLLDGRAGSYSDMSKRRDGGGSAPRENAEMKAWLRECGVPVSALARLLGVNAATVYGWLRGDRPPRRRMASRVARISEGRVPADSWDR